MSSSESGSSTSSLEACEASCQSNETNKNKKQNSLSSLAQNLRRGKPLTFSNKRVRKTGRQAKEPATSPANTTKKSPKWVMKFNCAKKERKCTEDTRNVKRCVCTCYRRTEEHHLGAGVVFQQGEPGENEGASCSSTNVTNSPTKEVPDSHNSQSDNERVPVENAEDASSNSSAEIYGNVGGPSNASPPFDASWYGPVQSALDDRDEQARLQRALEIAEGVEPPANFHHVKGIHVLCPTELESAESLMSSRRLQIVCPPHITVDSLKALFQTNVTIRPCSLHTLTGCHTQVDYIHCLVPDLLNITNCTFYWGKMDRYEAERLLEGKPEGTFLLRDSAQEEFLFSVSFRKYGRSLHARIEQWNHKFSFDSHDPSVFASDTVCGLIEHYKDPSSCMFFEPMLTSPLHRNFTFPLQHLCRAVITSKLNYDSVNELQLPKSLKSYLKEYHYRQKLRVKREDDVHWVDLVNIN